MSPARIMDRVSQEYERRWRNRPSVWQFRCRAFDPRAKAVSPPLPPRGQVDVPTPGRKFAIATRVPRAGQDSETRSLQENGLSGGKQPPCQGHAGRLVGDLSPRAGDESPNLSRAPSGTGIALDTFRPSEAFLNEEDIHPMRTNPQVGVVAAPAAVPGQAPAAATGSVAFAIALS